MSERKINLEEIFKKQNPTDTGTIPDWVRDLCIEACRQTLELAAENANLLNSKGEITGGISVDEYEDELSWRKIVVDYMVNKQSILNTINQIE